MKTVAEIAGKTDQAATRTTDIIKTTVKEITADLKNRFNEARARMQDTRPVAKAASKLLDGSIDIKAEVLRMTGVKIASFHPKKHKPVLLAASKFGVWASELTLVAGVLLKAGYDVRLATEDGSVPHMLGPSMDPSFQDGAWRMSVVSPQERDLAFRFLNPDSKEHAIFNKNSIFDLSKLAKPPQAGDYFKNASLLKEYEKNLEQSMRLASDFDAICIAGGSGAIPGLMFDRGLHSLILAFYKLQKPVMGECNGGLSILQTIDPATGMPILHGRAVTTHSMLDEYQSGWGWIQAFNTNPDSFWKDGLFDFKAYCAAEKWYQPGTGGNPLIDSEGYFSDAIGSKGTFFSPPGSPYSVVVDGKFITCRTTPDGYPGALAMLAILDGTPPLSGRLFIDEDKQGRTRK